MCIIWHFIRRIFHIHWQDQRKDILYMGICEFNYVILLKTNNINANSHHFPNLKPITYFIVSPCIFQFNN